MINLANSLTFSRIFLTAFFMVSVLLPGVWFKFAALTFFLMASLTDYFDGWAARRFNQASPLGALMDPIADKVLTISAFLIFVQMSLIPAWMAVLVAARDFLVTTFRLMMPKDSPNQKAQRGGKNKTVLQFTVIVGVLIFLILRECSFWNDAWNERAEITIYWTMFVVVLTTLLTGVRYVVKNKYVLG